jgi:hypothetical protein
MANPTTHEDDAPKTGPSGATDQTKERVKKFDEEGGDQPQAPSQRAVEEELRRIESESEDARPRPH